ncbi:MAG: hypothetical protein ACNA8O_12455 [Cyanobacteriota bacterium]
MIAAASKERTTAVYQQTFADARHQQQQPLPHRTTTKDTIKAQVLGLDGATNSVKAFDKDAFLLAVAEKVAEAKLAAKCVPPVAAEIEEVEQPKGIEQSPLP